jgi:hypothetical protein
MGRLAHVAASVRAGRFVVPLLAAGVLAAGCGGDDGGETTATAPPPAKEPGAIAIEEPEDDKRVSATEDGGRLGAKPIVSGTADAGTQVVVNGGCNVQGCVVNAPVGDDGEWSTEVRLDAPAGDPAIRVTVYYRGSPFAGPQDAVALRLAGPKPKPERARSGGGGGGGGGGSGGGPSGDPVPPESLDPPSSPTRGSGNLILIGDSLAVGIETILPALLPGWGFSSDALTSRPLDAGMGILASTRVPPGSVVAMSLFTNDDPTRTEALADAVRTSVRRAGRGGCAVWATIARPPFNGRSYAPANALLRRLDAQIERLAVVPWAEQASRNGWLAGDAVHATPEGYRQRARLYAEAARSC